MNYIRGRLIRLGVGCGRALKEGFLEEVTAQRSPEDLRKKWLGKEKV